MSPKLPTDAMVEAACKAICMSRKFESGQGTCAALCMDQLGDARRNCHHRRTIHGKFAETILTAALAVAPRDERSCTCHPDDNPPQPCPKKYALSECRNAADEAYNAGLEMGARVADHAGSWRIATAIRASKRDRAEACAESAILERDAAQAALREMREAAAYCIDRLYACHQGKVVRDLDEAMSRWEIANRSALASSGAAREEEGK